jgi:DNA-binding NtrC family response regulator
VKQVHSPSALVIAQADSLRFAVVEFLKARGWIVHGMRRIEQAPSLLQSLAYDLIIIDSKFPRLFNLEVLRKSIERQTIPVFLITNSLSSDFAEEATEHGVSWPGSRPGTEISLTFWVV